MKIGILKCDSVDTRLTKDHGEYSDMFIDLLSAINPSLTFSIYDIERHQFPQMLSECDAYLITGSRHGAYEKHSWIPPLEQLIRSIKSNPTIKLLGICFGHQIIAQALGGEVKKSSKGWGLGVSTTNVSTDSIPVWANLNKKEQLNLIVIHQDQVIEAPKHSHVILKNDFCPNYMLNIAPNILTIQGHPEFNKAYLQSLMNIKQDIIPKTTLLEATKSLEKHTDEKIIAHWFSEFLSQK